MKTLSPKYFNHAELTFIVALTKKYDADYKEVTAKNYLIITHLN